MPRIAFLDCTRPGRQAEDLEKKVRHLAIGQDEVNSTDREGPPDSLGDIVPGRPIAPRSFCGWRHDSGMARGT